MPDTQQDTKTAKLIFDGKELELPIMSPTSGPDVIDIRKLYAQGGVAIAGFTGGAADDDGNPPEGFYRGTTSTIGGVADTGKGQRTVQ